MPEPLATAFVRIRPDTSDFERDTRRDVGKAGRGIAQEGKKHGKLFGSSFVKGSAGPFRGMVGVVGGPLAGAFAALASIKVFKGFIDDARESNRIGRLTAQVIKSTGGEAKVSAKHVGDLATAISNKTGADDEAIQSGQNLLLRFSGIRNELGRGNKIFDRASSAVVNMAAAMNKGEVSESGIATASKALGKALNDPMKGLLGLKKAGITFTDQQKKQIETLVESGKTLEAQKIILDQVAKSTGGAAKAGADPLQRLKTIVGNVGETIGNVLLPYVDKAADFLGKNLPGAVESAVRWFKSDLVPALKGVAPVFGAISGAVGDLIGWFARLDRPMQIVVASLGALFLLRGKIGAFATALGGLGGAVARLRGANIEGAVGSVGTAAGAAAGSKGVGGLMGKISRFAGVFGPAGLAVGVLAGIISSFGGNSGEAAGRVDELTEALKRDSGALRDNTKAVIAKHLADSGLVDDARNAGVAFDLVTKAALGQKGAQAQLAAELESTRIRLRQLSQPQLHLTEAEKAERRELEKRVTALIKVNEKLGATSSELSRARKNARDHAAATKSVNKVTDEMSGKTAKAVKALREHAGKLGLNRSEMRKLVSRFGEGRAEFVRQARQMGVNRESALKLFNRLKKIPGKYRANITADTGPADRKLTNFAKKWRNRIIKLVPDSSGKVRDVGGAILRNRGGAVPGWMGRRGRDSIHALLTPDEHVIAEPEVRGAGGHAAVARQRALWRRGVRRKDGGPVSPLAKFLVDVDLSASERRISKLVSGIAGAGSEKLLAFSRAHSGRPYVWGGSGPFGFDCSGWVSALVNWARGAKFPYYRLGSTASFPWSGFLPGPGRVLSVGSIRNAGNGIGHMAASIGRIASESAGGVGVRTGGGARGAFDSLFGGNVWHPRGLNLGGRVGPRRGDPPFDLLDPRGKFFKLRLPASYRLGTPWVPEDQMAWLHKGEGVIPRSVNESRLSSGTVVHNHYHLDVRVDPMASPHETGRKVVESIKAFERASGSRWRS